MDEQPAVEETGLEPFLVLLRRRCFLRALLLSGLLGRFQVGCDRDRGVSRGGKDPSRGLRGRGRVSRSCWFRFFVVGEFFERERERVRESESFIRLLLSFPFPSLSLSLKKKKSREKKARNLPASAMSTIRASSCPSSRGSAGVKKDPERRTAAAAPAPLAPSPLPPPPPPPPLPSSSPASYTS